MDLPPGSSQSATPMMLSLAVTDTAMSTAPAVYWVQLRQDSHLKNKWAQWEAWVKGQLNDTHATNLPWHCTLIFDEQQTHVDYDECWQEMVNDRHFYLKIQNIYIGSQGAAAAVKLPSELQQWFLVSNAAPHITLLKAKGYKPRELGPMVKAALQVPEWLQTSNRCMHVSPDKQFVRILLSTCDEGKAGKVLLANNSCKQLTLTVENEGLLKRIPPQLWSQHKTDVGLVISAQPVRIKLKPNITLLYKKQYPLKQKTVEGIKPTIEGLIAAGVLIKTRSPCNTPIYPIQKPHSPDYRLVHDLRIINSIETLQKPL